MRPLWVISMKPSSISMFGVPYSPIVPSLTRWIDRIELGDRVEQVQGTDDVVHLGVDGVRTVDHRVRRRSLLGEVDDRVGLEFTHRLVDEDVVCEVADERLDRVARNLLPSRHPPLELTDRDQAVDAHLVVVLAPR